MRLIVHDQRYSDRQDELAILDLTVILEDEAEDVEVTRYFKKPGDEKGKQFKVCRIAGVGSRIRCPWVTVRQGSNGPFIAGDIAFPPNIRNQVLETCGLKSAPKPQPPEPHPAPAAATR